MENDRWITSITNLGVSRDPIHGDCYRLGVGLAILLDQNIRQEGAIRNHLFISNGAVIYRDGYRLEVDLNPGLGIEKLMIGALSNF